jgi:hypothetical protein
LDESLPGQWLTRQHRDIDAAVKQILDGSSDLQPLHEALATLRLHVWIEEEILFDPVAATGLVMPIYIMQYEHAQMWPLMVQLEADFSAGASNGP